MRFLVLVGLGWTSGLAGSSNPSRTLKVDAVELVAGKETPGLEDHAVDYGRYRYLFSSPANREAFLREPTKYEIQLGGACARMGPLSGEGTADIFAVAEGKVYIFASEQCRKRFLADPKALLEQPDPPVVEDESTLKRGRQLVDLAVKGFGGAERLDALQTLRAELAATSKHGDKAYTNRKRWTIRFPSDFRLDDDWDDARWAAVSTANDAFFATNQVWSMHPQQREALERQFRRDPLVILRSRGREDFVAAAAGIAKTNDRPVEFVNVSFAGTTTKLAIDLESGRVLSAEFQGRGPSLALGEVKRTYGDFTTLDGITVPKSWTTTFNGEPANALDLKLDKVAFNVSEVASDFERPR